MDSAKARRIGIGLGIVAAVYFGWGVFATLFGVPGPHFAFLQSRPVVKQDASEQLRVTPVYVSHSVSGGVHTYSGVVNVPPCQQLGSGLRTVGADPVRIQILLTLAPIQEGASCTELKTSGRPFAVSFTAPKDAQAPVFDGISLNGVSLPVTLKEE